MFKKFLIFGLLSLLIFSCKKDNSNPGIPFAQQSFFFSGRINSKLITYKDSSGVYNTASRKPASKSNQFREEQSSAFVGSVAGLTVSIGVNLYQYFPTAPTDTTLNTMFSTGSYQFWDPNATISGVEVYWFDGVKTWSTAYGTANQSGGSFFNITSHTPNISSDTSYKYVTGGNTSCTLYDGQGNSIPLSYSTFKLKTIHY